MNDAMARALHDIGQFLDQEAIPFAVLFITFLAACMPVAAASNTPALRPIVEVEEPVYAYQPASNGAGPMWCHGSTCLVRMGDDFFASGLETIKGARPLNNCRWMLFQRTSAGWKKVLADPSGRTREPCPLVGFPDGRLFLSANPTLNADPKAYAGPARPEILQFSARDPARPVRTLLPGWAGKPAFTEHSYRSFSADGGARELILFQNIGYTHAEWAFLDSTGKWCAQGRLKWPWGAEYEKPQPIRICYPNVALKKRAVHFCGVSDIIEPNPKWRAYKRELTGRQWDYDFRRLFYAWTPDITKAPFKPWVEIASREATCGWIFPCDLWVSPAGDVHVLWTERALDERLRKKFFPDEKQYHALKYALLREGRVMTRSTLLIAKEGISRLVPGRGRFHVTGDGRLLVFYHASGTDSKGKRVSENRLLEIRPDGTVGLGARVPLKKPFTNFFTTTPRAGTAPSDTMGVLGMQEGAGTTISFAQIRLAGESGATREPSTFKPAARWEYSAPLIAPEKRDKDPSRAQKDPTVVHFGGKWHVFMTVKLPGRSAIEYCSFKDWAEADGAKRTLLPVSDSDYYCAPQVFYFAPHKLWYLVYQMGVPGARFMWVAYSTTKNIADPHSWTRARPMLDGSRQDPRKVGGLDYWIICDDKRAYLFYTSLNGKMWRMWTRLEDFPEGFDHFALALQAKIFEASHTYRLKGMNQYLTIIEENGRRYFKAYVADRLDGPWRPVADTADRPFAGWKNIRPAPGVIPWTDNVSHGELIRAGHDQTLTVDPGNMRMLFQGMLDAHKQGRGYGQFQWRLGMLTPVLD